MAAKLTNSSDESSMGSAVYFSSKVFTENLGREEGSGRRGRNRQRMGQEGHRCDVGADEPRVTPPTRWDKRATGAGKRTGRTPIGKVGAEETARERELQG